MTNDEAEVVVRAAARLLLDAALSALQDDPHQWSERPCATCRSIGGFVGRPFGCYLYANKRAIERAAAAIAAAKAGQ